MAAEQPKKPPSGYWLWLGEHRDTIAKTLGSSKGSDVAKAAGEKWKVLSEAQRAPYEQRAADLKATFAKAMEDFKSSGGVPAKRSRKPEKPEKKVKDENAPKKPTAGGYGVFLAEKREDIKKSLPADHKITDVAKQAGAMWKALSEAEKKPYEEQFAEKMKAYKEAMEEYKKNGGQAEEGEEEGEGEGEGEASPEKPAKASRGAAKAKAKAATEPKAKAAPKRRAGASEAKEEPASKRGRKGSAEKDELSIDSAVLAEAQKLGWEAELKNLAGRPDVLASGKPAKELLEALKSSQGLVNPARRALLGA